MPELGLQQEQFVRSHGIDMWLGSAPIPGCIRILVAVALLHLSGAAVTHKWPWAKSHSKVRALEENF